MGSSINLIYTAPIFNIHEEEWRGRGGNIANGVFTPTQNLLNQLNLDITARNILRSTLKIEVSFKLSAIFFPSHNASLRLRTRCISVHIIL